MSLDIINLDGLSGAKISLHNNEIIKECAPSYSDRLLKQAELQNKFAHLDDLPPNVYPVKIKKIPNRTTVVMDFIRSPNLHNKIELLSPSEIIKLSSILRSFIKYEKDKELPDQYYHIKMAKKIEDIEDVSVRSKIDNLLFRSNPIPTTLCHGDLTLSNIIYSCTNVYLIDFLDGFISSYILDICKLRQDLVYNYSDSKVSPRRAICYSYIINEVMKECDIDSYTLRLFDVLNFARILPYVKDKTKIMEIIDSI